MRKIGNPLFDMNYKTMQLPMKAVAAVFALFVFTADCLADPFKPAVMDDADGFTNIRAGKGSEFPLVGKVNGGEVFYAEPSTDRWWRVAAIKGKTGFMSKDHIRLIKNSQNSDASPASITPADMGTTEDPNNAEAQYTLGLKYFYGFGIPSNREKSAIWFRTAAEQEHLAAKASLGRQYFMGEGVKRDQEYGMILIREGLEKGDPRAQSMYAICLATLYRESEGFSARNQKLTLTVISWLKKAAAQGGVDGARAAGAAREIEQAYRKDLREESAVRLWNALVGGGSEDSGEKTYGGFTDREIDAMAKAQKEIDANNR